MSSRVSGPNSLTKHRASPEGWMKVVTEQVRGQNLLFRVKPYPATLIVNILIALGVINRSST
jgi:hypothetical protein